MTSPTPPHTSPLLTLPPELLQHLLLFLPLRSLLCLSLVSRSFHTLVSTHSLPTFLRLLSYDPSSSTHQHRQYWSLAAQARWADDVATNFEHRDSTAQSFAHWERKCMPVLKVWHRGKGRSVRLVVGRGAELDLFDMDGAQRGKLELVPMLPFFAPSQSASSGQEDLTGIALDPSAPSGLILSRVSGLIQRVRVEEPKWQGDHWRSGRLVEVERYVTSLVGEEEHPWTVQALHSSGNLLGAAITSRPRPTFRRAQFSPSANPSSSTPITFSTLHAIPPPPTSHHLSLFSLSSPSTPPHLLPLSHKPWSLHLTPYYLFLGSSSTAPLTFYPLDSTGLPSSPSSLTAPDEPASAVYSLTTPPPYSTALHPTQTLIAAFYDSTTRIYDLRSGSTSSSAGGGGKGEVMRLADPWSEDPCYSVTCGGPSGGWVATGASREGMVRMWDVRSSVAPFSGAEGESKGGGATFFPPSSNGHTTAPVRSPIYSLALEYSTLYAVTDRQAFSLSFERRSRGEEGNGARYVLHEGEKGARGALRVGWEDMERKRMYEGRRELVTNRTRGRARMVERW